MYKLIRIFLPAVMVAAGLTAPTGVNAADPIVGRWQVPSGSIASIRPCGGSFCITMRTGKFAGKRIGKMAGAKGVYKGSITDPKNDKTYTGKASLKGRTLTMKGCVAAILCRSQKWKRR